MTALAVPPPLRRFAREHGRAIEAALGPVRRIADFRAPCCPALFLCFTNRCGSNYVAQLVASTGICNEAGEFFNAATVLEHAVPRRLTSLQDYVDLLPTLVPRRPVFAAKLGLDQLILLTDAGILDAWLPRSTFLLLERQDRVGQAISRVIASQTGGWSSLHVAAPVAPRYDAPAIADELQKIEAANAGLRAWFAANRVAPVHTTLEAMLHDPRPVLHELATRMGVEPLRVRRGRITLRRQAGAINQEWRQRFDCRSITFPV